MGETAFAETVARVALEGTLAAEGAAPAVAPAGDARYVLGAEIGKGGMGRVVEAEDRQFARTVAVKTIRPEHSSAAARTRFALEAVVTGNLEHPAIPPVYERGERDGAPFYVMRRVRGRTLAEALAAAADVRARLELLPALIKTAHAVGYAHERGVVHRDIKPSNILIDKHGETWLLDWGIAKVRGLKLPDTVTGPSAASPSQTSAGSVLGTLAYMAPEQARGEVDAIDERTDVFALGALLYHVLTGHAPYQASADEATASSGDVASALELAAAARYRPLASAAPRAPAGLAATCARAMAREPGERFRSAAELAEALETASAAALVAPRRDLAALGATALGAASILFLLVVLGLLSRDIPTLREMGPAAMTSVMFGAVGLITLFIEWRTRGRLDLGALCVALALVTFLISIATTLAGVLMVLRGAAHLEGPERAGILLEGLREALGGLIPAAGLTALQLVLWGFLRRGRNRRA